MQADVVFRQNSKMFFHVAVVVLMSFVTADYPPEAEILRPPRTDETMQVPPRQRPELVSCQQRNSCGVDNVNARLPFYTRNCFCDALCRTYDDCCADFRPESTETGTRTFPNIPRSVVTCARIEEIETAYEIYIVTRCPRGYPDVGIRTLCENDRITEEFYRLPVSGLTSGVLYRNAYCAMCANETAYLFWRMAHLCVGVGTAGNSPDVRLMMRCPPELLMPDVGTYNAEAAERLRPRKCKSHVSQCEPRRRTKGGRNRRRCRGPTSYVYHGLQAYRNAECAECNRVTSADCYDERTLKIDVDDLHRKLHGPQLPPSAVVLVIDLNAATAAVRHSMPGRQLGLEEPPPAAVVSLASCPRGTVYDPYGDECRPAGCSVDGSPAFGSGPCPSTTTSVTTTPPPTTTTVASTTTSSTTITTSPSTSSSSRLTTRRSRSHRRRTTTPWFMLDYDDDYYDYRDVDEYPDSSHTPSWQPRDAVLAWRTTMSSADWWRGRNRVSVATAAVGDMDNRRHWTTPTSGSGNGRVDGATSCDLLAIDDADYTKLDNGSVSVRFPVRLRGVYTTPRYIYMDNQLYVCVTTPTETETRKDTGADVPQRNNTALTRTDLLLKMFELDRVQSLASLVAVLVSMTALLVCLVVYLLFPALRCATSGSCLICLVICLFCAQLLFLVSSLHDFGAFSVVGDASAEAVMCYWLAVATHYVLLAGAFWLNVIAMDAARSASTDFQYEDGKTKSSRGVLFLAYSVYAWVAPAVIVAGSLAAEEFQLSEPLLRPFYAKAGVCWLAGRLGIPLLFALPIVALTVADLVLFAVAACRLPPGGGGMFAGCRWLVAGGILAVLMALLWAFALSAAYTNMADLWYVFIGLHAALGLYVCLAFAAMPDVLTMIRDSGSGTMSSRRHVKSPNYDDDPWRNGAVNGTQSMSRSFTYPVSEYDEIISQETSI